MSDIYGNHGCKEAQNVCEGSGRCTCAVTGHETMCSGVIENCTIRDEVWEESQREMRKEEKDGLS